MLSRIKKISLNWSSLLHWPRGFYHPANVFHSSMNPRLAFIYSYIYTWIHIFFLKINISKVSQKISLKDLFTCYMYTLHILYHSNFQHQFIFSSLKKKKKKTIYKLSNANNLKLIKCKRLKGLVCIKCNEKRERPASEIYIYIIHLFYFALYSAGRKFH